MVAHNWANQTNSHGKGSNFFYEGKSIWSYGYHFEVGRIVETERGQTIVLLQSATYSSSTQRHQSYARQACNHIETFDFPLRHSIIVRNELTNDDFVRAFGRFQTISIDSMKKATKARKYKDHHIRDAVNAVDQWNALKRHFPKLTKGISKLTIPDGVKIDRLIAREKAERKLERERQKEREKEDSYKWLNYERNYMSRLSQTLLRQRQVSFIPEQGCAPQSRLVDEVETSHGARVPLQDAKRFYGLIKNFKTNPIRMHLYPNLKDQLKVGNFRLSNLTPKGANIGCHFIAWSEMERFANQMGW